MGFGDDWFRNQRRRLDFGTVSLFSTPAAKVTQTVRSRNFMVSTPFDVSVTKSNVTSANYALSAVLTTVDGTNSWAIDTFPLPHVSDRPSLAYGYWSLCQQCATYAASDDPEH